MVDMNTSPFIFRYSWKIVHLKQSRLFILISAMLSVSISIVIVYAFLFTGRRINAKKVQNAHIYGTSGNLFDGRIFRTFPASNIVVTDFSSNITLKKARNDICCKMWSVVTTVFPPSDAVRKQANLGRKWCLVVVADLKSTKNYSVNGTSKVVYLTTEEQMRYSNVFPSFIKSLPWNHFGRKNVGFLYAVHHCAEVVWDFDDDNILKADEFPFFAEENQNNYYSPVAHTHPTYNAYVQIGAPVSPIWPRGFPLEDIKENKSWNTELASDLYDFNQVSIIQSLADNDPDFDAVYRLTQPLPVIFGSGQRMLPIVLPKGTMSPLNAQACMFKYSAFWMLFLPTTVHGRVSDIWRGYTGQRLLWDLNKRVAISPPVVNQFRNPHNYLADFNSEIPLYERSGSLVKVLIEWSGKSMSLPGRIVELYVELYERGFVEIEDVVLVQNWLQSLYAAGYIYPKLIT